MHPMAPIYYRLIKSGVKTINDVPDVGTLRQDVEALLAQDQQQPTEG